MAARHEALARDILLVHSDFFMAVYGYRKMHAQLIVQGWDPASRGGPTAHREARRAAATRSTRWVSWPARAAVWRGS